MKRVSPSYEFSRDVEHARPAYIDEHNCKQYGVRKGTEGGDAAALPKAFATVLAW